MALPQIDPIIVRKGDPEMVFKHGQWIFEPKYDGWRGMLRIEDEEAHFWSRRGNYLVPFDYLARQVSREIGVKTAILDGEITVLDPLTGYSNFDDLMHRRGRLYYMAFDLLYLDGQNIWTEPLMWRKQALAKLVAGKRNILPVPFLTELTKEFVQGADKLGLEGVVVKKRNDPYSPHTNWYKVLNPQYQEKKKAREVIFRHSKNKAK
jgi:bifunctional non-homologous end joining protein LigD